MDTEHSTIKHDVSSIAEHMYKYCRSVSIPVAGAAVDAAGVAAAPKENPPGAAAVVAAGAAVAPAPKEKPPAGAAAGAAAAAGVPNEKPPGLGAAAAAGAEMRVFSVSESQQ